MPDATTEAAPRQGYGQPVELADIPDNVSESRRRRAAFRVITDERPADGLDNRPLSDRFAGWSLPGLGQQLDAKQSRERWLVDGDVGPSHSDNDIAVNGDMQYRFR